MVYSLNWSLGISFHVTPGARIEFKSQLQRMTTPQCSSMVSVFGHSKSVSSLCALHRADALRRGHALQLTFEFNQRVRRTLQPSFVVAPFLSHTCHERVPTALHYLRSLHTYPWLLH